MRKLRYVERTAKAFAAVEPMVKTGEVDITPDDMKLTVEQFYEQAAQERQTRIDVALDAHLAQVFLTRRRKESKPAAEIIRRHADELVEKITYWTGVPRPIVDIMTEVNRHYEEGVRRDPANWFWVHRRWKPASHRQRNLPKGSASDPDPE